MTPDLNDPPGNRIFRILGNRLVVAALFIIVVLLGSIVLYGYYHALVVAPRECCVEVIHPRTHTEYGYYSVNDFLYGNNITLDAKDLMRAGFTDEDDLNLVWSGHNQSWMIKNPINDTVPFRIYNPATGLTVTGVFTPNLSTAADSITTDILVVNWNDTAFHGSCYSVYATVTPMEEGYHWVYNSTAERAVTLQDTGQYAEIRVRIPLPDAFLDNTVRADLSHPWLREYIVISEKNCSVEDYPTKGSRTVMLLSMERE